jgi:hypothetical protein
VVSTSARGPVRLGFPAHAAGYWLPGLYLAESPDQEEPFADRLSKSEEL